MEAVVEPIVVWSAFIAQRLSLEVTAQVMIWPFVHSFKYEMRCQCKDPVSIVCLSKFSKQ